ncbi:hypothetical protein H8D36_05950 [archaeon]|nr:hypothetical protein [archaeon]
MTYCYTCGKEVAQETAIERNGMYFCCQKCFQQFMGY